MRACTHPRNCSILGDSSLDGIWQSLIAPSQIFSLTVRGRKLTTLTAGLGGHLVLEFTALIDGAGLNNTCAMQQAYQPCQHERREEDLLPSSWSTSWFALAATQIPLLLTAILFFLRLPIGSSFCIHSEIPALATRRSS